MAFPDIHQFPESRSGPYEQQMGESIVALLRCFSNLVPDSESNARVLELANTPNRWSAGHGLFDEVRCRLLTAIEVKDRTRSAQYYFEESCLQAMYNATDPPDPFDPASAFFVAGQALILARAIGEPVDAVIDILTAPPI